ncbi:hypothetical protein SAMN02745165_01546 [Malonomonas rubra DSM 5091]|uniref:Autotransporter domain-containing protein n=1 Tax=Malonomonas rubra DSM 5091 TaxID=1122189 RepID=A0A1M6GGR9_MALRU|nr:autotransporter outer membrane beta-barrel domain-containing protein [Malonomonas rubra]SHJ09174.1 hypothetical protein SAMN02745165_01546 [Malonomonas rubra DSM 5091]
MSVFWNPSVERLTPLSLFVLLLVSFWSLFPCLSAADDQETVVTLTGTDGSDYISPTILDSLLFSAEIETEFSEKVEASATGIDSLAGDDRIEVGIPMISTVAATAMLLNTPEKATEANATSIGIVAGDGNDTVTTNTLIDILGASLSLYGDTLEFDQPPSENDSDGTTKKEVDASTSASTEVTAVKTGGGIDSITNSGLLALQSAATSGGTANQLTATIRESSSVKIESKSNASATGLQAGNGEDRIRNDGSFTTSATSTSGALAVGLVAPENSAAEDKKVNLSLLANSSATASVSGIQADADEDASSEENSSPFGLNGLGVTFLKSLTTVSGDDQITNNALLTGDAVAVSGAGAGAISNKVNGSVQTEAKSTAEASVVGVNAGGGNDLVINAGELLSTASATSGALAISVEVGASDEDTTTTPSKDRQNKSSTEASSSAKASAVGISGDGGSRTETLTGSLSLDDGILQLEIQKIIEQMAGDDSVTNHFAIQSFSLAKSLTDSIGVNISGGGSVDAKAKAAADAYSAAVSTGFGGDSITNLGALNSQATASATAVSVGLAIGQPVADTPEGEDPPAANDRKLASKTETDVNAKSRAFGIDSDGPGENSTFASSLQISDGGLFFSLLDKRQLAAGDDWVNNTLAISAGSQSTADSTSASIQIDAVGSLNSTSKAHAEAESQGVATGAGDDVVINSGLLLVDAVSVADSVSLGLSVTKPPEGETVSDDGITKQDKTNVKVDSSVTAQATTTGIDAEGKDHLRSTLNTLEITGSELTYQLSLEKESLAGVDSVSNTGAITSDSVASSGATSAGISINADGSVDAEANSKASAHAGGVLTGGGSDQIENQGVLSSAATATATALSASVSIAQPTDNTGQKPSAWEKIKEKFAGANSAANAEATAYSSGIDSEGDAGRQADQLSVNISSNGLLIDVERDFSSTAGDDQVVNSGILDASASAQTLAGAADVKVNTEGTASAESNATAKAGAKGIVTGGADDQISNSGVVSTLADAEAGSVSVSFTQPDGPAVKSKVDSKATAEANATGIGGDGGREAETLVSSLSIGPDGIAFLYSSEELAAEGADTITNTGSVSANALSVSGAGGGAVSLDGAAKAEVTAKSSSQAVAVDAGGGADLVSSAGQLNATADAVSGAIALGFGQKSEEKSKTKVELEAGATADSTAVGIRGDSGADQRLDIALSISGDGLVTSYQSEQIAARGDDEIQNFAAIDAAATSAAGGLGVSMAIDGVAKAEVTATAKSQATAIEAGGGNDQLLSAADIEASAASTAAALAVGVGKKTNDSSSAKTKVEAKTVAEAKATGINADGGLEDKLRTLAVTIDGDGLLVDYTDQSTAVSGDDELTNTGAVTSAATASSGALAVAVSIDGAARADINSTATANATALDAGSGSDTVHNSAELLSTADATSATLNVAVTSDGNAVTNAGLMDGGNKAQAAAIGISSSGGDYQKTTKVKGFIDFKNIGVTASYEGITDSLSGDGTDEIYNSGDIIANSSALAPEVTAGVSGEGLALSIGRTQAEASANAIESGNLDDVIDNHGNLTSEASATAVLANVAVVGKGLAVATNAVWDGGTKATATANGIAADSGSITTKQVDAEASADIAYVRYSDQFQAASGNDRVNNSGQIDASSFALAPSLNVAVNLGEENKTGLAAAVSTSSAEAQTTAIRGGDGDDELLNTGLLNATADANAVSANVAVVNKGVAAAADAVWDGGTKADASAVGIAGDGGDLTRMTYLSIGTDDMSFRKETVVAGGSDKIDNRGEINADANANAGSVGVAVAAKGVGVATSTATAEARAAAIDAGSDDSVDEVYNSGKLKAESSARAAAASVSVTNQGLALSADSVWDGGTSANSEARGIDVGVGGETLTNDGQIDALAHALAASASLAATMTGVAGASATATSKADAVAIDASEGEDDDTLNNNGALCAKSDATAAVASVSVVNEGLSIAAGAVWDGGTGAESVAKGIAAGAGQDTVKNTGAVTTKATSKAAEAAVSVAVTGVAGAIATSTGEASATAIDAGEEDDADDTVINSGDLTAEADALAATATVSVTTAGVAVAGGAAWSGGTKANAQARGIEAGEGSDFIDNSGAMTVRSNSDAAEAAVAVAVSGVAAGVATATSSSDASAIDTGDDTSADLVSNSGALDVTAHSLAATTSVSVTTAGVAVAAGDVWDGGTEAESRARGIEVGEGGDEIENTGDIISRAIAESASANLSVAVSGVAGAIASSSVAADAAALDVGTGDFNDSVVNTADIDAVSSAVTASAAVSFTAAGVAVAGDSSWSGGTNSTASAQGIILGGGDDAVTNTGSINADSTSSATGSSVAIAVAGVAAAIASADANAKALGINAGTGDDSINSAGSITVKSLANGNTLTNADSKFGVSAAGNSVWDGGAKSTSASSGISGDSGLDQIISSSNINSDAVAISTSTAISFTVGGVSASVSTSTASATADAIDGGDENDLIDNSGNLDVMANANAISANLALAGIGVAAAGDSVWDGGTTATANASGISGGEGEDIIRSGHFDEQGLPLAAEVNHVDAVAEALVSTNSLSVTAGGVSAAVSTGTASAAGRGIDAGSGDDTVINASELSGQANAEAYSVSVALSGVGGAGASDAFWDGGTKATADAYGIDGGSGNDQLSNLVGISADAASNTVSAAVAVSGSGGLAGAVAASTSTATATGISGADGEDEILTMGTVNSNALAEAEGVSISFSGFGAAVSGAPGINTTVADARAIGLSGGSGGDFLGNETGGAMVVNSTSRARETAVSIAYGGGIASANANSSSSATSIGFDGGSENDLLQNNGSLVQTSDAQSIARSIQFAGLGASIANANAGSQAISQAFTAGDGDDDVYNRGSVDLTSTASAIGQSVSVTLVGASIGKASAEAQADSLGLGGDGGNDRLDNSGEVAINTFATAQAASISAAQLGYNLGEANSEAGSVATGISGGDGTDTLLNSGKVTIAAETDADATSIAVSQLGYNVGKANTTADVSVSGMAGGDGDDTIINQEEGEIELLAKGDASSLSVSITVGGVAAAEAASLVLADVIGMQGDEGDDMILNAGLLGVRTQALSTSDSASVSFLGATTAKAGTEVESTAIGIAGGTGSDYIENSGSLWVGPEADAIGDERYMAVLRGSAKSGGLGGASSAEASAAASVEATGIDGGDEADTINNLGDITVNANSLSVTKSGSVQIFGSSSAEGIAGSTTFTRGIDGGAGNDLINNSADLKLEATSELRMEGGSYSFAGSSSSGGTLAAMTSLEALQGGDGDDFIASNGAVDVIASSIMESSNGSSASFGGSVASVTSGGRTFATGFSGGAGDDYVENGEDGKLTVTAETDVDVTALSYSFAGGSATDTMLSGNAVVTGLKGESGDDRLRNEGTISVLADSVLTSTGGAKSTITASGGADATGSSVAGSTAVGLDGGEGDDVLESYGSLSVNSRSTAEAFNRGNNSISFTSDTVAGSITSAAALAVGIDGGNGSNSMFVDGLLDVDATSIGYGLSSSSGAEFSFDGDGKAWVEATSIAEAAGITGGDAGDQVAVNGDIFVDAFATTAKTISTTVTVYRVIGTTDENSDEPMVETISEDVLPEAGSEGYEVDTVVFWNGTDAPDDPNEVGTGSYMIVVSELVDDDDDSDTDPVLVYSWEPTDRIVEEEVLIEESGFPSYAFANGNGFPDGDGYAEAGATATATSHGVQLGDGDDSIKNYGNISVKAQADAVVNVGADGDSSGDARGIAISQATARALGMQVGAGNNNIYNFGTLDVRAIPVAQARTDVSGGDYCIWFFGWHCGAGGDGIGTADAYFTAEASGIQAENGNNLIVNDGEINVSARPDLRFDDRLNFDYAAIVRKEDKEYFYVNSSADAYGIRLGDAESGNTVVNNGILTVSAYTLSSECDTDTCRNLLNASDDSSTPDFEESISAIGILTGSGNDTVINSGAIIADIVRSTERSNGTAIKTGAGNDTVTLSDAVDVVHPETGESLFISLKGDVDFGSGDDTLHLIGTPIVEGDISLGEVDDGVDSLIFEGDGFFERPLNGFENAKKLRAGTYQVPSLPTMQRIEIEAGTLQTDSNYQFAEAGFLQTQVNSDGSHGKLYVKGTTTLAGDLSVLRDSAGPYIDGTEYDIIEGTDGINSSFSEVNLPTATRLVSFNLEQQPTLVAVEAQVESYTSVARNPVEIALGRQMDTWMLNATGELQQALGEFQTLNSDEFAEAFLGFSPGQYDSLTQATSVASQQYSQTLLQRIHSVRLLGETTTQGAQGYFSSGDKPILLAFNGPVDSIAQLFPTENKPTAEYGMWLESYGQWGEQDAENGFVGSEFNHYGAAIGLDYLLNNHSLLGFSLGYSSTRVDMDQNQGDADVDSLNLSIYGSFFNEKGYLDGVLAYGQQEYESTRNIRIGAINEVARGEHDGYFYSVFLEGGYNFNFSPWILQPFANLAYAVLSEDGFTEQGAGTLSQVLADRETNSLVSQLGVRISPVIQLQPGKLIPEASLALQYDFEIDDRKIQSSFVDQPGTSFTIEGSEVDNSSVVVGVGVTYLGHNGFTPAIQYSGEFRDGFSSHSVVGELRWEF